MGIEGRECLVNFNSAETLAGAGNRINQRPARLLQDLEGVKERFRVLEEDDDGYGIGTLHSLSRKMQEGAPHPSPQVASHQMDELQSPFDGFLSDLRNDIPRYLRMNELLLALDAGQLYLFALSLHLFRSHEKITEEETLHFTRRFLDARSILFRALVTFHAPRLILHEYYRFIVGVSNILVFLQQEVKSRDMAATSENWDRLPFVPFGASWQKAQAEVERRNAASEQSLQVYNNDVPHYLIYRIASDLTELATSDELKYLARMFPRTDDIDFGTVESGVLFHWLVVKDYSESWDSEQGEEDLFCIKIEHGIESIRVSGWNVGRAQDVEGLVQAIENTARRAVLLGPTAEVDGNDVLKALSSALWPAPEEDISRDVPITILAEGPAALIPFAALITPSNVPWCRDHPIALISRLFASTERQSVNFTDISGLIVANPDFGTSHSQSYSSLPETAREADAISKLSGWRILSGKQASVEHTLEALGVHPVVHIASHGDLVDDSRFFSLENSFQDPIGFFRSARASMDAASIVLAGSDGVAHLRASMLSAARWPSSELVFLSLCRGSSGTAVGSEAPFSVARALKAAGSKRVVASLYPIDDTAACEIAVEFHTRLRTGTDPAEALRQAQLALIERGYQWHVWGGYQLIC